MLALGQIAIDGETPLHPGESREADAVFISSTGML